MDAPGTILGGRYELQHAVGSGGMATVWKALQRGPAGFERPVAIKRIKHHLARDPEFVRMFVEEARVCSQLVHPNVVQIHDFGDEGGLYYLVMEWVEGLSVAQYLRVADELGSLPVWQIVAGVGIEALRGLAAAHGRRNAAGDPAPVYHRDVTPQNIMLGTNGVVKLTDFGLARAMDRARITAPDIIKGKVGYLAPELTEERRATAKTDLYALGVVLWQSLAGQALFAGKDNVEIFLAARRGEVPPISEVRADVPARFAAIVERALARDPKDRFESAAQMGRVIANMLRDEKKRADPAVLGRSVQQLRDYRDTGAMPQSSRAGATGAKLASD